MTHCAFCPRPADPRHGMCPRHYERDLIRGARVRWEAAEQRRREARETLADVAHAAVDAAISTEPDRDTWFALFAHVEDVARAGRFLAKEAIRLHNEAAARALELWQLRGRTGKIAYRAEDLPPEEATP